MKLGESNRKRGKKMMYIVSTQLSGNEIMLFEYDNYDDAINFYNVAAGVLITLFKKKHSNIYTIISTQKGINYRNPNFVLK